MNAAMMNYIQQQDLKHVASLIRLWNGIIMCKYHLESNDLL